MKVYLKGALLRSRNSSRIVQVVEVKQEGTEFEYLLKPLVKGRWKQISHASIDHYYIPVGMGTVEADITPPSLGTELDEDPLEEA